MSNRSSMTFWSLVIIILLSFFIIVIGIYSMLNSHLTTREVLEAEKLCAQKGYESIKNLDKGKGYKQVYTVHCVTEHGYELVAD